jgi:diketogulonate reductase-like aldo/keto reductase
MANDHQQPTVALPGGGAMPMVGFGTWQLTGGRCYEAVRHALDVGYRHIDTATIYGNEREVGRAVRDSGVPREDVFITTKLPPREAGRERRTITRSLQALGTDYVDLWLVHWPPNYQARLTIWKEFLAVRDDGLARAVGVSNYRVSQLDELREASGEAPAVNQIRWAPPLYDATEVAQHRQRGVVLEGYSPLKATNLRDPVVAEVAAAHGVTPAQVVLRWHLDHDIVVIPKSKSRDRIEANFDLFGFSLSDEELRRVDGLAGG